MVPNVSSFYNSSLKACRSAKGVVRLGQVDDDTLTLQVPQRSPSPRTPTAPGLAWP